MKTSVVLWFFSSVLLSLYSVIFLSSFIFLFPVVTQASQDREALRHLPIQDFQEGRVKPFDTFARETLQLIYGREKFKKIILKKKPDGTEVKWTARLEAVDIIMMWILWPEEWKVQDIIQIRHSGLREALGLDEETKIYFSPLALINNQKFPLLSQELHSKVQSREKLNPYFQAVQTLESQLGVFMGIAQGKIPRVMPQLEGDNWLSISELQEEDGKAFYTIVDSFISYAATHIAQVKKEKGTYKEGSLKGAVESFRSRVREKFPDKYGRKDLLRAEVHYEKMQPFMVAWLLYLMAVFFFGAFQVSRKGLIYKVGWAFVWLGMLVHTYGMGLRVFIQQRPPVGTMYETVIWVPWVALICAMVLECQKKRGIILMCAALVSVLCLMISDLAPVVLNDSMQPLEPVLRDNFWLLTHVIIIVSSYGAFFLSFALADVVLFHFLRGEEKYRQEIKEGVNAIYRAIQVGFVLLAAGTILGGVWADYSWGRFWGWDPKETWAFIALMGYLAILHGRLAGWFKDFGMAAGAVLGFSLVIMAWYGVNFVLGAGLHSYGFGAGGVEYVSGFVALHFLYLGYVATVRYARLKSAS